MILCKKHPNKKAKRGLDICSQCVSEERRKVDPDYKMKQDNYRADWVNANKEYVSKYQKERKKTLRNKDPVEFKKQCRRSMLWSKYRLTEEDYKLLNDSQNGLCFICKRAPAGNKPLHVDHDHETGRIRGLLCHQCNWYLGSIDSDKDMLERLNMYRTTKNILDKPDDN